MDWLIIVIVAAATALAMVIVFRIQQNRLRRRFRLEIQNVGNARSRYQLRAEDSGALQFRFTLDGDDLPQALSRPGGVSAQDGVAEGTGTPAPAATLDDPPSRGPSASQRLNQASGLALLAADVLMAVGSLLPASVGGPLLRRASQLQMGRIRVAQASRVSRQVGSVGRSAGRRDRNSAPAAGRSAGQAQGAAQAVPGQVFAETPYIRPGDTLALELVVKTGFTASAQQRGFRIVSRSVEQEEAPLVVEEAQVRLGGGIWGHRYLPYFAVLTMGALVLVLALWLSAAGAPF